MKNQAVTSVAGSATRSVPAAARVLRVMLVNPYADVGIRRRHTDKIARLGCAQRAQQGVQVKSVLGIDGDGAEQGLRDLDVDVRLVLSLLVYRDEDGPRLL